MPILVKGRLKANLAFWRDVLQAPPAVLNVIESGYVLPWITSLHGIYMEIFIICLPNTDQ